MSEEKKTRDPDLDLPIEETLRRAQAGKVKWFLVLRHTPDVGFNLNSQFDRVLLENGGSMSCRIGNHCGFIELPNNRTPMEVFGDMLADFVGMYPEGVTCTIENEWLAGGIKLWNHHAKRVQRIRAMQPADLVRILEQQREEWKRVGPELQAAMRASGGCVVDP